LGSWQWYGALNQIEHDTYGSVVAVRGS